MEMDTGHPHQSSPDYTYTVDGGIPDAQFDQAMNSHLEDALRDDQHVLVPYSQEPEGEETNLRHNLDQQADQHSGGPDARSDGSVFIASFDSSESDLSEQETADDPQDLAQQSRTSSPSKRPQTDITCERPFKRKCTKLNPSYLDLLNKEIREAARRGCTEDNDMDEDGVAAYRASQLGPTAWSLVEKRILYETTSRLGRGALSEISASIGSKSVVEVEDYLSYLHRASEERKSMLRPVLQPAERPAAVEISPQCCHALDEVADSISVLQERKEEKREEQKWGASWNITWPLLEGDEVDGEKQVLEGPAAELNELFDVPNWLSLSADIFMNSAVPSNNWNYVDEEPPAIWATAMEDFQSVALSITRRLVQTTLFMAMSRLRAKRELEPRTLGIVRREDVDAALRSLNMEDKRHEFWRGSARRLRLNVRNNETGSRVRRKDDDEEEQYMTFEEVENALRADGDPQISPPEDQSREEEIPKDTEIPLEDGITKNEVDVEPREPTETTENLTAEDMEALEEAEEVFRYSGVDFMKTTRSKDMLLNRISGEMKQEEYADHCDEQASRDGEVKMWEMLQKPVPQALRAKQAQEQLPRSNLAVEGVYSVGRNWRRALQYYAEWETQDVNSAEDG